MYATSAALAAGAQKEAEPGTEWTASEHAVNCVKRLSGGVQLMADYACGAFVEALEDEFWEVRTALIATWHI